MYSRKSSGYPRFTPPPNYNGVAFTRNYMPSSEVKPTHDVEPETPEEPSVAKMPSEPPRNAAPSPETDRQEDDAKQDESTDESECSKSASDGIASRIIGKDMSLEDLLLIGAVILFVSGEFDGDLMLLLGLLLIAGL